MKNQVFWRCPLDPQVVHDAGQAWGLEPWVAEYMLRRGFEAGQSLEDLDTARPLDDPENLPDMKPAVWTIRHVLKQGGRVRVYGDYDADGVTATAVMVRGLRLLGYAGQVDWYIPNRFDEGYGLSVDAVWKAHQDGVQLMVTVDCGSSSPEAADLARSLGLLLVITDHHALPSRIPDVEALVNPECRAPVDRLSGAGVALQVVRALMEEDAPPILYGIAAVGTVADVVPITGNNRRLVVRGLAAIQQGAVPGFRVLFEREGREWQRADARDLGFLVGPRLNAAGRMGDAEKAVQLLLEDAEEDLTVAADGLVALNAERREVERRITEEAWERLPRDEQGRIFDFPVIAGEGWHQGVIGIVASRFREWLGRPIAVVAWDGAQGKGSARSVPGFNLIAHLRQSSDLFSKLGGHPGAAGFSLPRESSETLSRQLSNNLPAVVHEAQRRGWAYDFAFDAASMPVDLWEQVQRLEPFGQAFEAPRFLIRGSIRRARTMGSEGQHLSFELEHHPIRAVAFGQGWQRDALEAGAPVRFLASLETNWFRGKASPQWRVEVLHARPVRRSVVVRGGHPEVLPARIVWVVDSDRAVREWSQKLQAAPYLTSLPIGELMGLEERARRGLLPQVVVSQWRIWPRLAGWADAVIWLAEPRNRGKCEESAALLREGGSVWLDGTGPGRAATKAKRLEINRERLGRHWKRWQAGAVGLVPGRAIFDELGLRPDVVVPGERRNLESSFLYQQAVYESRCDADEPFSTLT